MIEIIYKDIDELETYQNNPRNNAEAVDYVAESIREFGFKVPVVIDINNVIIAGHTRVLASRKLNITKIPCIIASDLTDEQVRAFRLADNKVGEIATWDMSLLMSELETISDIDMTTMGFDELEHTEILPEVKEDDFNVEVPATPKSKYGDIYQLGRHRLMCGDSTSEDDVTRLMDGKLADMLLTDPPYNVAYEGKTSDKLSIQNDNMDVDSFRGFLAKAFAIAYSVMKKGGVLYMACGFCRVLF